MNDLFIPTSSIDRDFRPIHVSNFGRQGHDFYPTPTWVTQTLLDRVTFRGPVWEPCCGDGAIARQIEARGNRVVATDLSDHGYGAPGIDFLACNTMPEDCRAIVTNPPYGDGGAERAAAGAMSARLLLEFVEHGIRLTEQRGGQLALLVRYTWIAGKRAAGLISSGPLDRVIVLTKRIQWFDKIGRAHV